MWQISYQNSNTEVCIYYEARLFVLGVSHAWITPHGISPSLIITTDMQTFLSLETTFKLKQPHEFNATCVSRLMICDKGTLHRAAHRDQLHMQNHLLYHLLQINWPSLLGHCSPLPHCCQTTQPWQHPLLSVLLAPSHLVLAASTTPSPLQKGLGGITGCIHGKILAWPITFVDCIMQ